MKSVKWLVSAGIFIVLTTVKVFVPGAAVAICDNADKLLNRNIDYQQVLNYLNDSISEVEVSPAITKRNTDNNRNTVAYSRGLNIMAIKQLNYGSLPISESDKKLGFNREVQELVEPPEIEDDAEIAENTLPEAVQTFLDSQAEYSAYEPPMNVDYDLYELPFEHSVPVSGYNSSGFGYRLHPIYNEVKFHYGTDVAANTGESIGTFADGIVSFAGYSDSYGNFITIDHGDGWQTLYAHCSKLYVNSGDNVTKGQQIALVGATGNVTGPHLHFELTHNGVYVNPEYYVNY